MQARSYVVYDVFTDAVLSGNPLAVVLDADGLDTQAMQRVAARVQPVRDRLRAAAGKPGHRARIRIFTPRVELPFAGHPTWARRSPSPRRAARDGSRRASSMLEENVGPVRCAVSHAEGKAYAEFDLPRLAEPVPFKALPEAVAAALGLGVHEIGFENHRIGAWSAGVPYVTVPVRGLAEAAKRR